MTDAIKFYRRNPGHWDVNRAAANTIRAIPNPYRSEANDTEE